MAQSLPVPRGTLARRRPAQPQRRRQGSGNGRSGGWKTKVGNTTETRTSEEETGPDAGSNNNNSHPRSRELALRGEESRTTSAHAVRGGGSKAGGSDVGFRGRGVCGEAWGSTTTVAAARHSERAHSSGAGSSRGGKTSAGSDVWAWAGAGGGGGGASARGKAMLSAYGLQADRHNPTCPRGVPGDVPARHGRWQRGQGGAAGQGDGSGVSTEEKRDKCAGGKEESRCGGVVAGGRSGEKSVDRGSSGHGQRPRGGKASKQRPSGASGISSASYRTPGDHSSTWGRDQDIWEDEKPSSDRGGQISTTAASETRKEKGPVADVTAAISPRLEDIASSRETGVERDHPGDHIRRALEGLLVPSHGSMSCGFGARPRPHRDDFAASIAAPAAGTGATVSQQAAVIMDGRGGSAAPPHRPQQLSFRAPASSAANSPIFPNLAAPGGGLMPAFEPDNGSGQAFGEDSSGGDDHSTPSVSRQRAHSHHSPWHARKQPRGFTGGRSGDGLRGSHNYARDRSLGGERTSSGMGGRPGMCLSSESPIDMAHVPSLATACAESGVLLDSGPDRSLVTPPLSFPATAVGKVCDGTSEASREWRASTKISVEVTSTSAAAADDAGRSRLDVFDRLLHDSTTVTPHSELIDHFKLAPRPTSRRGTRSQGAEGEAVQPEPAFCLFSGHRDDRSGGVGRGEGSTERGESERRSKSREDIRS